MSWGGGPVAFANDRFGRVRPRRDKYEQAITDERAIPMTFRGVDRYLIQSPYVDRAQLWETAGQHPREIHRKCR